MDDETLPSYPPVVPPQRSIAALIFFLALFLTIVSIVGAGHLGYVRRTESFAGFSSWNRSIEVGLHTWWFRKGQNLVVDYDLEVRRGMLYILVFRRGVDALTQPYASTYVRESGKGTVRLAAPEDGLYKIMIHGTPDGTGYDLSYTVTWGYE